jgi:transposase-like protein
MVAESFMPGASVSRVALRYGVNAKSPVHLAARG